MDKRDIEIVRQLIPLNEKSEPELRSTISKAKVIIYQEGKMIFKRGDVDNNIYWLLNGAIDLLDEHFEAKHRKSRDDASRYPIDNNDPHTFTAVTTEESRILVLDRKSVGLINPNNKSAVGEIDEDDGIDWMTALLSSPLFEFVPPANIQQLFSKFEEVDYDAGDVVIKQGDPGDYFYVIQSGKVKVERSSGGKSTLQATLKAGDNFGQDALISDVPRNATVTMLNKGRLVRLSEPDFESLLVHPVLETISMEEAQEMLKTPTPKTYILDVRNPKEVELKKIPGATNVPFLLLRKQNNMDKLKQGAIYIAACDGGKRSELAAYLLNENGFTAYVLKN